MNGEVEHANPREGESRAGDEGQPDLCHQSVDPFRWGFQTHARWIGAKDAEGKAGVQHSVKEWRVSERG